MRRILVGSLVGVLLTASSAFAADDNPATTLTPVMAAAATTLAQRPELAAGINFAPRRSEPGRPLVLPTLYASSALLQGYDAYSTLNAINHGATEANPLMKGVTRNPMAFIGIKAGVTVMSIMAAERMWKNNNRLGAVLTMVASNSMMALVAAHNASVLSRVK
jgi:uncharacterized protein DUF5658